MNVNDWLDALMKLTILGFVIGTFLFCAITILLIIFYPYL